MLFLIALSRKVEISAGQNPGVSIIVCAHDEEKNLRELIPILLSQDYADFEVIVVEDRCNDGTYDYLLEAVKSHKRLRMVRVTHLPPHINGKKFALTLGIKAATFDWVLLTDADCRPGTKWLASMATLFHEKNDIVIGYSPYVKERGYLNDFIRFESLMTGIQFMSWALLGRPYMGVGRNLGYRKALFLSNKGFNKHLGIMGGDDDLFVNEHATKSNVGVCIGPASLTPSIPKKTWQQFFRQKIRHLSVGKHYRFSDKLVLGIFSATWVLSWLFALPMLFTQAAIDFYLWAGFVTREILVMVVVHRGSRTLGDSLKAWKTPLLDFNYAIYYLGTGLVALVSKRVRWTK
ncbi:MAG TPA: glycosyltransferase [Cyclobacteriaceae bacterium]|nr:glycosyltransferase [Cyclobacteriaceae bacterium]